MANSWPPQGQPRDHVAWEGGVTPIYNLHRPVCAAVKGMVFKQFGLGWGTYRNQGVLVEYGVSITRKVMSGVKNFL